MIPADPLLRSDGAARGAVIDSNVETVRGKLLARAIRGLEKYGKPTSGRDDLALFDWLAHLQEELMDASVYIEAAINSKAEAVGDDAILPGLCKELREQSARRHPHTVTVELMAAKEIERLSARS